MRLVSVCLAVSLIFVSSAVFAEKPFEKPTYVTRGLLDCSDAIPIYCDDVVTGDNTGAANNVETYGCVSWTESGGEVVYELVIPGPECYIVTAALSDMICDLDVFILGSCEEADCITFGNTSATTPCLEPGTYYIVVDGYFGAECSYTLTITCEECTCPGAAPENDTCDGAIEVFYGDEISGDLTNATNNYDPGSAGCTGYAAAGKDVTYVIDVAAGEKLAIKMAPQGFDASLYVVTDCDDVAGTCIVGSDNCCTGADEVVVFSSAGGGTYYIICDACGSGNGGPFWMIINKAAIPNAAIALHVQNTLPNVPCDAYWPGCPALVTEWGPLQDVLYFYVCMCGHAYQLIPEVNGFTAASYGLTWPANWTFVSWISCAPQTIGTIQDPGDFVEQSWDSCMVVPPNYGPVPIGVLALMPTSLGEVRVIEHAGIGRAEVADCHGGSTVLLPCEIGNGRAGYVAVGGGQGCNPCPCAGFPCYEVPSGLRNETWGSVKSLFK
ncbi:MAG: PPC domain-containing protein [Candidatus Eisenbacteria sp.]|nr:PPC domain-containing protein [Candidatus Eisenbacteria bacterium]